MTEATTLKKLSTKTILGGNPTPPAKGTKWLYRVFGVVSGFITGESANGNWVALVGQFEAHNEDTGEVYQSAKAFVPSTHGELLGAKAKSLASGGSFRFAVRVGVVKAATKTGYEYVTEDLMDVQDGDALADIRAQALGKKKAK